MSFWKKLFGGNKPEGNGQINKSDKPEHAKMIWASEKNCWCAALWLAVEVLKKDSDSVIAKDIFIKSLANSCLGIVTISNKNRKKKDTVTNLLRQGMTSLIEAKLVAETLVSVFYVQFVIERISPLIERFNKGEIRSDRRIDDSDLNTAQALGSSFYNEMLPGQKVKIKWKSRLGIEEEQLIIKNITSFKNALVTMLQANSPSDWQKTCKQLEEDLKYDRQIVDSFKKLENVNYTFDEFIKYRDEFLLNFTDNIARMMQMLDIREPIIEL